MMCSRAWVCGRVGGCKGVGGLGAGGRLGGCGWLLRGNAQGKEGERAPPLRPRTWLPHAHTTHTASSIAVAGSSHQATFDPSSAPARPTELTSCERQVHAHGERGAGVVVGQESGVSRASPTPTHHVVQVVESKGLHSVRSAAAAVEEEGGLHQHHADRAADHHPLLVQLGLGVRDELLDAWGGGRRGAGERVCASWCWSRAGPLGARPPRPPSSLPARPPPHPLL